MKRYNIGRGYKWKDKRIDDVADSRFTQKPGLQIRGRGTEDEWSGVLILSSAMIDIGEH